MLLYLLFKNIIYYGTFKKFREILEVFQGIKKRNSFVGTYPSKKLSGLLPKSLATQLKSQKVSKGILKNPTLNKFKRLLPTNKTNQNQDVYEIDNHSAFNSSFPKVRKMQNLTKDRVK